MPSKLAILFLFTLTSVQAAIVSASPSSNIAFANVESSLGTDLSKISSHT